MWLTSHSSRYLTAKNAELRGPLSIFSGKDALNFWRTATRAAVLCVVECATGSTPSMALH
jgi:hypothetical protein